MIGMPTYGRSFKLVDNDKFDIGAPASGGGPPGKFTNEAGFLSYYEVEYYFHYLRTELPMYLQSALINCISTFPLKSTKTLHFISNEYE